MNFTEHGVFEVKIEDNILVVDAQGPFNEELIIQYEKALETCIKSLESSNWHQIIILHQFSLFTPEAEDKLVQTLINRKTRGLVACAVVLIDIEAKSLITAQMNRCYNRAGVKHEIITSIGEAKNWLSQI